MRKPRVLFAGVAVAAAAVAAGSAFTASNDVTGVANQTAGYGEVTATGVTVTDIAYSPWASDGTYLNTVTFTTDGTPALTSPTYTAALTLKKGGVANVHGSWSCVITSTTVITCNVAHAVAFTDFTGVGLTVVH